jgi:hypothetical protein
MECCGVTATTQPNPDKAEKAILRLNLARQDFLGVKNLAETLMKNPLDPRDFVFRPYIAGIVTTYCRSFLRNDGIGPLGRAFRTFDDEALKDTHDKLLRLRHRAYAHRDALAASFFTSATGALVDCYKLRVRVENDGIISLCSNAPELNPENLPNIVALCALQSERASDAVAKLLRSVMKRKSYPPGTYTWGSGFP